MKTYQIAVFLVVVFTVYFLGNAYIFIKGYNAIPGVKENKTIYTIIFLSVALTFKRTPLEELMQNIDHSRPVILLDHQPLNLEEAKKNGVDLQLSGHTHNGQFWPLNYFTKAIYEISYGYGKKGNTQYIVSSGFGIWGPRIRSASKSEVLLLKISFTGN